MKRTLNTLLPAVLFAIVGSWLYDAVFATRTTIILRNVGDKRCDSVNLHVEWEVGHVAGPLEWVVASVERHQYDLGSIEPGERTALDIDPPIGIITAGIGYRAGAQRRGLWASTFAETQPDLFFTIDFVPSVCRPIMIHLL